MNITPERIQKTSYSTPAQTLTIMGFPLEGHRNNLLTSMGIILCLQTKQTYSTDGRGKCALLHGHRLFGEKTRSAESRKAIKRKQNYKQWMRKLSF